MFKALMPKRREFFDLLAAHSDRVVAGANATLRLVSGLGNANHSRQALIDEVNLNEQSADDIKDQFNRLLYESFTTPINRDQLHSLILDLDRVLDNLQSLANTTTMYRIEDSTAAAREMASLAADACLRLHRAVIALSDRKRHAEIVTLCHEIEGIEARSDTLMREAVTQLFRDEGDEAAAWHAMKMRRFYFKQEDVLDGCKRAARTIEEILIENA